MKRAPDPTWLRSASHAPASTPAAVLRLQLERLGSMLAIQHSLHAQRCVSDVVDAVFDHAGHVHPCDAVMLALDSGDRPSRVEVHVSWEREDPGTPEPFSTEHEEALQSQPGPLRFDLDPAGGAPGFLAPLVEAGMRSAVVLPLFADERFRGFLALGHRDGAELDPDRAPYLAGFADAAALALKNASSSEKIQALAKYDSLTGLPNRRIFFDRLHQIIVSAERDEHLAATFFVDLDGFKRLNDTLGHAAGDIVIRQVAQRLVACLRRSDSVCRAPWPGEAGEEPTMAGPATPPSSEDISRIGGDEFAVMLSKITDAQDAALVAKRILGIFERPYQIDGQDLFLSASIGIAIYPSDGIDTDTLLRNADTAMYCAKKRGKRCFQFYTKAMNSEASRRLHIETRMRAALERGEFEVWYQPQREASRGSLVGAEALLRWDDPEMGMVSPAEFIPLAEQTGCIVSLGEFVLRSVCMQLRAWHDGGRDVVRMAVNLSAYQLRHPDFVDRVAGILAESRVSPGELEFEITETAIMDDDESVCSAMRDLRTLGVGLTLDDFGTGYSSLSYLRRFSLDCVKIDRSFVLELPENTDDRTVTEAIIAMAHGLKLRVVAEGVETEEQARYLREIGCDELQGFLFGRPAPAHLFEQTLATMKTEDAR